MSLLKKRYRTAELLISVSILSLNNLLFAQKIERSQPPAGQEIELKSIKPVLINTIDLKLSETLLPSDNPGNKRTSEFLDSLRARASKTLITRKLYDFLITSADQSPRKELSGSSDLDFVKYSGKRIRKIEIRRLSVFGSNINTPLYFQPDKVEKLLNNTHINTSELIIRKNLLFKENDTLSPLTFSDNERLLRQLPYIDDSRIIIVPVSENEVDVIVFSKDIYSLGATFDFRSIDRWTLNSFEKNVFGTGHELRLELSKDTEFHDSPGIGIYYNVNNISRSFINANLFFLDGLGKKTFGLNLERKFISSETKYAGGISLKRMFTTEDLDTLPIPEPLRYNLQDYWFGRSFLLNRESVARLFLGIRYTNNNVFDRPFILPDSYYYLQKYNIFLGSVSFSMQKYYKTNLIYSYGRTEDIPYGGIINFTAGKEINEFKDRNYAGISLSLGETVKNLGYFYTTAGVSAFFNNGETEQGLLLLRTSYFSNLLYLGGSRVRNFIKIDYTRGFDRYNDEFLTFTREDGFSGFRNDSTAGEQRLSVGLETVIFNPADYYGFRFAFFGFAEFGMLFGTNEFAREGDFLSSIGIGVRIRNDNLLFNTFQIRLGYFPNLPEYSKVNYFMFSGERMLKPYNFDPGPPSLLLYR